jgi:hypothetical protein
MCPAVIDELMHDVVHDLLDHYPTARETKLKQHLAHLQHQRTLWKKMGAHGSDDSQTQPRQSILQEARSTRLVVHAVQFK